MSDCLFIHCPIQSLCNQKLASLNRSHDQGRDLNPQLEDVPSRRIVPEPIKDAQNRAHLGDLGLALEVKDASRTALAGLVGGTKEYWSPEKLEAGTQTRIDPFK
ncbi:hypothetical protein PoB_000655600, partial [Plakobranchus ocellatus]